MFELDSDVYDCDLEISASAQSERDASGSRTGSNDESGFHRANARWIVPEKLLSEREILLGVPGPSRVDALSEFDARPTASFDVR